MIKINFLKKISRALIREPELLLLDEPFSNLDSTIKESMKEEIFKIFKETNTITILVTHDINDPLNISDRILIFKAGILQQYDDPVYNCALYRFLLCENIRT